MSDPYVVLVTIDFAPWDSDIDTAPALYGFDGLGEAQEFYDKAVEIALATDDIRILVYEPLSVTRVGNAEDALAGLQSWIGDDA